MGSAAEIGIATFVGGVIGAAFLGALAFGALTLHAYLRERVEGNGS